MANEKTRDVTGQYETPVELVRRAEREASSSKSGVADSAREPDPTLARERSADGLAGALGDDASRNGH
jgi:hypothetical protein